MSSERSFEDDTDKRTYCDPPPIPLKTQVAFLRQGAKAERDRIVAWLRETGGYKPGVINTGTRAHVADAIERGEHAG